MSGSRAVLLQRLLSKKDEWIHAFWRRHWLVLGVFAVTLLADALTTIGFMIKDGIDCRIVPLGIIRLIVNSILRLSGTPNAQQS